MNGFLLYCLFFVSGIAGLIYEVCWVRQFGNVFGNTVYSASLVTAVFMCGLGIGSRSAGGWADRRLTRPGTLRALLRTYGAAEIGVALLGLLLANLLPRLGVLSAGASSYVRGPEGWYELSFGSIAMRYVAATLLIAPPTFLMGATLTLLIRVTLTHVSLTQVGWRIGALYAVNTAGAALGAYACDSLLVPHVGIFNTQLMAAIANIIVGAGAFALARSHDANAPVVAIASVLTNKKEEEDKPTREEKSEADAEAAANGSAKREEPKDDDSVRSRHALIAGSIALALSGFAALGMEIIWFRFLSVTLGAYRYVFGLVLAVILTGIWLGALASGFCQRRFGRALELFIVAQVLVAVSALVLMATFRPSLTDSVGGAVRATLIVVGFPALLMGFSFPLVNAHVQDTAGAVARRAGSMYLANTVGGVAGSLVAGLVLTPLVGSQTSFLIFASCAALAPFALVVKAPLTRPLQIVFVSAATAAIVAIAVWVGLPSDHLVERFFTLPPNAKVVEMREGPNEIVTVVDQKVDGRMLFTNGHPMSGTAIAAQRYMRAFAHLPLLMTEGAQGPERALIICFGVGNTIHATSLHPSLTRIEIADLSRNVLEHAHFFRDTNHDVLRADPRVAVFVADGRQHLRQQPPSSYDLVTLEPPPLVFAGVSALYSREFYEIVKSRLKPRGFMTQWLPAYQTTPELALAMVRAFIDVFPNAALLSGTWGELILIGTPAAEPLVFDLDKVEEALQRNGPVAADLQHVAMGTLTEIVGSFLADGNALREMTANVSAITDDRPQMEYAFGGNFEAPAAFFTHTADLPRFCPKCFVGDKPDPRVSWLPIYMDALRSVYAHERFRRNDPMRLKPNPTLNSAAEHSLYIAGAFGRAPPSPPPSSAATSPKEKEATPPPPPPSGNPPDVNAGKSARAREAFIEAFKLAQSGSLDRAATEYERGLALDPADNDARYNLAVIYASTGREDDAVGQAELVLKADPSHTKAKKMLCTLRHIHCE